MRKLAIGLGIFVVVLVLIAVIVPLVVPADTYRSRIVDGVQAATGRQLRIDGPISFSILPSVALEASGVALSNAPGGVAKDMATLGKLEVGLKLFPLLGGNVEISRFVLVDPVIHLEVDKLGHANWDFSGASTAPQSAPANIPAKTSAETSAKTSESQTASLRQLELGDVKLSNGTIDYSDARNGTHEVVEKVDVNVKLPSLDDPSSIDGNLTWHSKTVKMVVSLERPRTLFGSGVSAAKVAVSSDPINFTYDGTLTGGQSLGLAGSLSLDIPSVRDLASWTGNPIPLKGTGLGPFSLKGKVSGSTGKLALSDVSLALDAIKGTGALAVDTTGAKPAVKGKLDIDMLDLNPYLASGGKTTAAPPSSPSPAGQPGGATDTGWSTAPIDMSALKMANVDFALGVGGIRYEKIAIGKSALSTRLQDGKLTADLSQLALYQGSGSGKVTVDASGATPAIVADFTLSGVQAEPLLTAAIDFTRLTGTGNLNFSLVTHGASQRDLVSALDGKGAFAFKNGSIKGVDLLAMVKNVATSFASAAGGSSDQTPFAELGGTFTMTNGVARNDDLALKSPAIQLSGAGTVDLPQRRVDYRVQPAVGIAGTNIAVPVLITGPWSNISYRPDLKSMIGQNLGKAGAGLLKGATGAHGAGAGAAGSVLKGLFGGK